MKITFFLFLMALGFSNANAQLTGCLYNGQMYTSPPGSILSYWTNPIGITPFDCPRAINFQVQILSPICSATNILGLGREVTYSRLDPPLGCPLDDYVPLLLMGLIIWGGYKVHQNQFS